MSCCPEGRPITALPGYSSQHPEIAAGGIMRLARARLDLMAQPWRPLCSAPIAQLLLQPGNLAQQLLQELSLTHVEACCVAGSPRSRYKPRYSASGSSRGSHG